MNDPYDWNTPQAHLVLSVRCSRCNAGVGQRCFNLGGKKTQARFRAEPHEERRRFARTLETYSPLNGAAPRLPRHVDAPGPKNPCKWCGMRYGLHSITCPKSPTKSAAGEVMANEELKTCPRCNGDYIQCSLCHGKKVVSKERADEFLEQH